MDGTQWTTLAGTALGALVGVGSTLLVDRARRRHDHEERSRQERKDIYVTCLARYRLAYEAMHDVAAAARPGSPGLAAAVRDTFRSSGCDEVRETALILAPEALSGAIEAVYTSLRELADVFAAGDPPLDSPEFQAARLRHAEAVWAARAAMRLDLAPRPPRSRRRRGSGT